MPQDYVLFTADDVMNGIHPVGLDMRTDDHQDYLRFYYEEGCDSFRMRDGNVVGLEGLLLIANSGIARHQRDILPDTLPIPDYLRPIIPDTPPIPEPLSIFDTNTPTPPYATLFNRRHYNRIASVLSITRQGYAITPDQKELMCGIVEAFAKLFSSDNKRFDRQQFISACNS